jgi:anaphase-promoting complex subunit 4
MKSAWESILIELDAKLAAFSESQKDAAGTDEAKLLEHEFMALLVRGIPSIDLEHFLVRELSPKLKALGSAVESSYRSIQRLAVTHFNQAIQALLFRLGDVSGLAEWTERFGLLGIDTRGLEKVTGTLGSLAHKSAELVRRIDSSRTSFKAFFAWLNKVGVDWGWGSIASQRVFPLCAFGVTHVWRVSL